MPRNRADHAAFCSDLGANRGSNAAKWQLGQPATRLSGSCSGR